MHREPNPAKGQDVRREGDKPAKGQVVRQVGGEAGPQNDGLLASFRREVLLVASLTGRTAPSFTTCAQLFAKMATVCHFLEKLNELGSEIGEAEWP